MYLLLLLLLLTHSDSRFLEPEIKEKAEEREKAGIPSAESAQGQMGETRKKVAKFVGVSHDTLAKAEKIVEAAEKNPQKFGFLLKTVDSGKISINSAYQKVKTPTKESAEPCIVHIITSLFVKPEKTFIHQPFRLAIVFCWNNGTFFHALLLSAFRFLKQELFRGLRS